MGSVVSVEDENALYHSDNTSFTFNAKKYDKRVRSRLERYEEQADQQIERVCSVCRRYECNVILAPCGHIGCCLCFSFCDRCPICDKTIDQEIPMRIWSSFKRLDPWAEQIDHKKGP